MGKRKKNDVIRKRANDKAKALMGSKRVLSYYLHVIMWRVFSRT